MFMDCVQIYPREEYGYAILYFTGSDYFNRSMRLYAKKLGYTLSDHGLVPAEENKNTLRLNNVACETEEEVFKVLGLEYKSPFQREM